MFIPNEQKEVKGHIDKIMDIYEHSDAEIRPHFFLTGASGSGKTYLIKMCCAERDFNFIEINGAQLTKEGTAGNSLSKALSVLRDPDFQNRPTICFVDEFDKLFISGNSNHDLAHDITNGVQNEFLKVLESETTSVFGDYGKYNEVDVSHVLFIFAGAFNGETDLEIDRLRDFGVKTEFLGRVGLLYALPSLSVTSLRYMLEESKLLENFLKIYPDVEKDVVVKRIMGEITDNHHNSPLGARILNKLLNKYFIEGGLNSTSGKRFKFRKGK